MLDSGLFLILDAVAGRHVPRLDSVPQVISISLLRPDD